jgi:hypothetical protein
MPPTPPTTGCDPPVCCLILPFLPLLFLFIFLTYSIVIGVIILVEIQLIQFLSSHCGSHLIVVPAGVSPISALQTSPLFEGTSMASATSNMGGGGDDFDIYGGIDPSLDPELAMAIRVSQEEARAQEEARLKVTHSSRNSYCSCLLFAGGLTVLHLIECC